MAVLTEKRITELPIASELNNADRLVIVQNGTTMQASASLTQSVHKEYTPVNLAQDAQNASVISRIIFRSDEYGHITTALAETRELVLSDLQDVNVSSTDNTVLWKSGNAWINKVLTATDVGAAPTLHYHTLPSLTDVTINTPDNGELLIYDGNWKNKKLILDDISNVRTSGAQAGQALISDGGGLWFPGNVSLAVDDLSDVAIGAIEDKAALIWNAGGYWEAGIPLMNLHSLTDVAIVNPGQNDVLTYTADGWRPRAQQNSSFSSLSDTPNGYDGKAGLLVAVNQTEDGLVFVYPPWSGSAGGGGDIGDDTGLTVGQGDRRYLKLDGTNTMTGSINTVSSGVAVNFGASGAVYMDSSGNIRSKLNNQTWSVGPTTVGTNILTVHMADARVGIGTDNPNTKLEVKGNVWAGGPSDPFLEHEHGTTAHGFYVADQGYLLKKGTDLLLVSNTGHKIYTNKDAEAFIIDSTGKGRFGSSSANTPSLNSQLEIYSRDAGTDHATLMLTNAEGTPRLRLKDSSTSGYTWSMGLGFGTEDTPTDKDFSKWKFSYEDGNGGELARGMTFVWNNEIGKKELYVGIAEKDPREYLHVGENTRFDKQLTMYDFDGRRIILKSPSYRTTNGGGTTGKTSLVDSELTMVFQDKTGSTFGTIGSIAGSERMIVHGTEEDLEIKGKNNIIFASNSEALTDNTYKLGNANKKFSEVHGTYGEFVERVVTETVAMGNIGTWLPDGESHTRKGIVLKPNVSNPGVFIESHDPDVTNPYNGIRFWLVNGAVGDNDTELAIIDEEKFEVRNIWFGTRTNGVAVSIKPEQVDGAVSQDVIVHIGRSTDLINTPGWDWAWEYNGQTSGIEGSNLSLKSTFNKAYKPTLPGRETEDWNTLVNFNHRGRIGSPNYTSGFGGFGWRLDYPKAGTSDFTYSTSAEAEVFIKNNSGEWTVGALVEISYDADLYTGIWIVNVHIDDSNFTSFARAIATGQLISYFREVSLEVDNLSVRKKMRVHELEINKIRATNGSLWVSDAMVVSKIVLPGGEDPTKPLDSTRIRLFTDEEVVDVVPFRESDIIRAQEFKFNNGDTSGVYVFEAIVAAVDDSGKFIDVTPRSDGDDPWEDMTIVRVGNTVITSGRQGAIYMSSSDNHAPFINVLDGVNDFSFEDNVVVRVGNLEGLSYDGIATEGYGLFGENVYLTGALRHTQGAYELRPDGSGSLAHGKITWTTTGELTIIEPEVDLPWGTDNSNLIRWRKGEWYDGLILNGSLSTNNYRTYSGNDQTISYQGTPHGYNDLVLTINNPTSNGAEGFRTQNITVTTNQIMRFTTWVKGDTGINGVYQQFQGDVIPSTNDTYHGISNLGGLNPDEWYLLAVYLKPYSDRNSVSHIGGVYTQLGEKIDSFVVKDAYFNSADATASISVRTLTRNSENNDSYMFNPLLQYADGSHISINQIITGLSSSTNETVIDGGRIKTGLIDADAVIANAANIGGWKIEPSRLWTGIRDGNNTGTTFLRTGMELYSPSPDTGTGHMRIKATGTSEVKMFFNSTSDWGLVGITATNDKIFELGSTNQIAGWKFQKASNDIDGYLWSGGRPVDHADGPYRSITMRSSKEDLDYGGQIAVYHEGTEHIKLYYDDADTWGLTARDVNDSEIFHLGSHNQIAQWQFTKAAFFRDIGQTGQVRLQAFEDPDAYGNHTSSDTAFGVNAATNVNWETNSVFMYYNDSDEYGITAFGGGEQIFHLGKRPNDADGNTTPDNWIAGWQFDYEYLWTGTKKTSAGYTTKGITLDSNGAFRAQNFRLETNGDAYFRGNGTFEGNIYASAGRIADWYIGELALIKEFRSDESDNRFILALGVSDDSDANLRGSDWVGLHINSDVSGVGLNSLHVGINSKEEVPEDENRYEFGIIDSQGGYITRFGDRINVLAGWTIESNAIFTGIKQESAGYTTEGITIHSDGAIRAPKFRLETDGSAYFKGDVTGASGTFSGTLSATDGRIGGWRIESHTLESSIAGTTTIIGSRWPGNPGSGSPYFLGLHVQKENGGRIDFGVDGNGNARAQINNRNLAVVGVSGNVTMNNNSTGYSSYVLNNYGQRNVMVVANVNGSLTTADVNSNVQGVGRLTISWTSGGEAETYVSTVSFSKKSTEGTAIDFRTVSRVISCDPGTRVSFQVESIATWPAELTFSGTASYMSV